MSYRYCRFMCLVGHAILTFGWLLGVLVYWSNMWWRIRSFSLRSVGLHGRTSFCIYAVAA